jgi:hypothetical protein
MSELTLEAVVARLVALEKKVAEQAALLSRPVPNNEWLKVVGMFDGSEFMRQVDAEGAAIREADRDAARRGDHA